MISIRGKLADHVGVHVVLSPEGAVLVTSPGTESSYPRPLQSLHNSNKNKTTNITETQRRIKAMWYRQQEKKPGGYKLCYVSLIKYGERSSMSTLALGYPLLGPSLHLRAYSCMPYSSPGFLCSDPLRHETFRPLFRRFAQSPLVLGCSQSSSGRPLYRKF